MKWKETSSKLTYKEILQVGSSKESTLGLHIQNRYYQPVNQPQSYPLLWMCADILLLLALVFGLVMLFTDGYGIQMHLTAYLLIVMVCILTVVVYSIHWKKFYGGLIGIVIFLTYILVLFFMQDMIVNGAKEILYCILVRLHDIYEGQIELPQSIKMQGQAQWLVVLFAGMLAFWFGFAVIRKNIAVLTGIIVLPFTAAIFILGGKTENIALFLILFGQIICIVRQYPVTRRRMMGGENLTRTQWNTLRYHKIQKKGMAMALFICMGLSVAGYYVVRPVIAYSIQPADKIVFEVKNRMLEQFVQWLPEKTGGIYDFEVETKTGGITDGSLKDIDGYTFQDIDDLKITISEKPQERIYLRGYIGSNYQEDGWTPPYESNFIASSINWNMNEDSRLYMKNLAFLRMSYQMKQQPDIQKEPVTMTVEKIHANDTYTYVPYAGYLNAYYPIQGGDGAVLSQQGQEDTYLMYWRKDADTILTPQDNSQITENILDRYEEAYRAYCSRQYLQVAEELSQMQDEIKRIAQKNHWNAQENEAEITDWIRNYFDKNFTYDLHAPLIPQGQEFLSSFLYDTRTGYSVHFASAAVELYRMFGIPARYVVGYQAPQYLFAVQQDGSYQAVLKDTQAQAWVEIYKPGIGWYPEEMTPGKTGTLDEVGQDNELIQRALKSEQEDVPQIPKRDFSQNIAAYQTWAQKIQLERIIRIFAAVVALILIVFISYRAVKKFCIQWGYNPLHTRTNKQILLGSFAAICVRIHKLGLSADIDSESQEFVTFAEEHLKKDKNYSVGTFSKFVSIVYESCYGQRKITMQDIILCREIYRKLL